MDELYFYLMRHHKQDTPRETKRIYRAKYRAMRDPLLSPIRSHSWRELWDGNPWRRIVKNPDSEYWYEYAIVPADGWTDADIAKAVKGLYVEINSPYDCTGKPFTVYIHWKRTKVGVVIVRCMGLDV